MTRYFRQDFFVTEDGTELYFELQGEGGPATVLCDGLGCDGFAWRYLAPRLAETRQVLRWHYRGHGKSGHRGGAARLGLNTILDDLDALLKWLSFREPVILFGHSMGVQVALEYHRRRGAHVAGLILICGSYGFPLDTVHDTRLVRLGLPAIRYLVERYPEPAATLRRVLMSNRWVREIGIRVELNSTLVKRQDMAPYFDHLASMDPLAFVRTLESIAEHDAWDHLPHVRVPTLVIGGANDKFTPIWLSRRMAASIPDATYVEVPTGSHTTPLEHPGIVWESVVRKLAEIT